ncbi:divalent cation transporter [Shimia sp. R11_0]|uniref:ZIP family metal transporter n=1 Tax=Shimia sp. R11_0 TaxID=2821096 RepID=UPI001ADC7DB6|nr:divalent cation transporter [Shimia sp. R11_0]MBO9477600.1 divalent cation transporter [Shimia sp. R11_0]
MEPIHYALLLSLFAGLAIPVGGALARWAHIANRAVEARVLKSVTAFGGGALLSAIALVLVPEGAEALPATLAVGLLLAGGLCFAIVDWVLARAGGSGALVLAMLLDFLPEAMALGALLVTEAATAKLLAVMMFLQNLPEGFAAFRDIWAQGKLSASKVLLVFVALAGLGPLCAGIGFAVLSDDPEILGGIMIFAAGGILYLVFQDIAPEAHEPGLYAPALGAVAGFALGLAGDMLIG